jgi:SAM-dependent methyltransferase
MLRAPVEPETDADALGAAYERTLPLQRRRREGVFYTPPALARDLAQATLGELLGGGASEPRVMDPACGGGAFLVAAYRRLLAWHAGAGRVTAALRRRILERSIFGVDIDADAVAVTRRALAEIAGTHVELDDNIRVGDALLAEDPRRFDVVLANPPYLDAETMTRHHPGLRAACNGRYEAAAGNWDLFCVFIERCLEVCAVGGRVGMIVPNKLLSADYARAARGLLVRPGMSALRSIRVFDARGVGVFAAEVYPIAFVAARGGTQGEVVCEHMAGPDVVASRVVLAGEVFADASRPWALCGGEEGRLVARVRSTGRPLGELAEVRGAATVAEAYAIAGLVREGPGGLRMINSGTIDAYEQLWGRKRMRYLGSMYMWPVIPDEFLTSLPAKRLQDARTPKVIVSGMTRRPEAVLDRDGTVLAGKSTTIVTGAAIDLRYVVAVLNSGLMGWYYRAVFGGARLSGGYLTLGPPQIRQVPVAAPEGGAGAEIAGLVEAMMARPSLATSRAIDAAVAAVFGLSAEEVAWVAGVSGGGGGGA